MKDHSFRKNDFITWLKNQPYDRTIGETGTVNTGPLVHWLHAIGYTDVCLEDNAVSFTWGDNEYVFCIEGHWIERFLYNLHSSSEEHYYPTVKQCLAALRT